ncbi:hypothetical protein L1987_23039 [Smallanthus sonchifolius]|uniref:Uncharacterized protein n=1 Tax=Smallanthus sonchifolius TaxID=185202 RepID=A0ACB9II03_9ASTR|nr:hypothetical protein L1987_23039 [Smallanthus sonchifolius]
MQMLSCTMYNFLVIVDLIIMKNENLLLVCVKKLRRYYHFDTLKLWPFLAYVVSFVSLAASVGLLIQDALVPEGPSAWTGTTGVLQCVLVLISGLVYRTSHRSEVFISRDLLAHAIADEMQKVYTKEPVPLTVEGEVIDEEDMYFLNANNESDDDVEGKDVDEKDGADLEKRLQQIMQSTKGSM